MQSSLPWGELAALGSAFLWACTSLLFTTAGRHVSPVATNAFKTVAASLLFAVALWIRDGLPFDATLQPRDIWLLAGSGVLGLTLGDSLLFLGYQILGTRRAMLVTSLYPIFGAVGAWLVLGEGMGLRPVVGMLVALAGVGFVILEKVGAVPPEGRRHFRLGILLCIGAAVGQAGGALLAKSALARADAFGATQIRVLSAALALIVFALLRGHLQQWVRGLSHPPVLWRVSVASFFGPFVAIFFMLYALKNASTGVVLTLLSMSPVFLLPLGAVLQHDRVTWRETVGALVALGGIALLVWR